MFSTTTFLEPITTHFSLVEDAVNLEQRREANAVSAKISP